jgi:hypothetical protein
MPANALMMTRDRAWYLDPESGNFAGRLSGQTDAKNR